MTQVFNFSAGPAMMPKAVLEQAQTELLNWQEQGINICACAWINGCQRRVASNLCWIKLRRHGGASCGQRGYGQGQGSCGCDETTHKGHSFPF